MLPSGLFYFSKYEVRKLKIRKVDDKPMVIHTKEKAKIHAHEPKGAKIKGGNIYTVERGPKTISASNYYDIMAVYMVKHCVGDTATVMNDTSKGWLQFLRGQTSMEV